MFGVWVFRCLGFEGVEGVEGVEGFEGFEGFEGLVVYDDTTNDR